MSERGENVPVNLQCSTVSRLRSDDVLGVFLRDISEHAVFTSTCIVSGWMTWLVCSSGTKYAVLTSTCIVCRVWWRGWCVCQGQEPDSVHVYLYRLYGAMTCGLSCLPWVAPRFRTFANRRAVLFSKALVSTGIRKLRNIQTQSSFSIRHQVSNLQSSFLLTGTNRTQPSE